ncbi:MAG: hypothetical protein ACM37W_16950 [Actinomycetota bacterium]
MPDETLCRFLISITKTWMTGSRAEVGVGSRSPQYRRLRTGNLEKIFVRCPLNARGSREKSGKSSSTRIEAAIALEIEFKQGHT